MICRRKKREPIDKFKGVFVLYKGDEQLCEGTIEEIAKIRGRKVETIKYYLTDVYKGRVKKSKNPYGRLCLIPLDYDLEDDE